METASATGQPAGLPSPTNAPAAKNPQSLTSVDEHLRLGELELEQGNFAQAQMHFDHVLLEHPNHVKANHRLGVLADKTGQFLRAEQYYQKAVAENPRNAALLSDLGYSYWLQHRYAESERYLLEARKLDPNYDKAIANLGLLYGSTGRREEALAMLAQIGDTADVQQIMKQIADGQFQPSQPSVDALAQQRPTTVVTTQSTAQHAAQVVPQDINAATREFVEQMRLAREELQRAEERLALQQEKSGMLPRQISVNPGAGQQPPEWAQHVHPSHEPARPETQYAGVNPFPDSPEQHLSQDGQSPDAALAEQVAAINPRIQHPSPHGQIVIGARGTMMEPQHSQPGPQGELPIIQSGTAYPHHDPQSTRAASPSPNQQQSETREFAQATPEYWPAPGNHQPRIPSDQSANAGPAQPLPTGRTFTENAPRASSTTNTSSWNQHVASSHGQSPPPYGESAPSSDSVSQLPPAQQVSVSRSRFAQRPVESAHYTQPQERRPEIVPAGQTEPASQSLVPPTLGGHHASQPERYNTPPQGANRSQPAAMNSYEQARREAALMGLGAGPGQVFPYIRQRPHTQTGAGLQQNGSQYGDEYPAAVQHMPADVTSPHQVSRQPSPARANLATPENDLGQSMPTVPVPTTVPGPNTGAASPYYHYQQSPASPNQSNSIAPYRDTRVQQSGESNGRSNQTWSQPPHSSPYGVTQTAPMGPSGFTSTGPAAETPPMIGQPSQSPPQSQTAPSQYRRSMTVPEQYRSGPSPPAPQRQASPQNETGHSGTASTQPYTGPVIVPSRR